MRKKGDIFSIEEIISIQRIGVPRINKDGSLVAYEITSADWKEDKYVKELWLYDVLSDSHKQIVRKDECYVGSVKWSPNGKFLAMILKDGDQKDGGNQIYIIDAQNMEKHKVSAHDKGITSFIWSTNSKGFYYSAASPNAKKKEERDKVYGAFTYVDEEKTDNSLFYLDLKKGLNYNQSRYELPEDLITKSKKDKKNKYYPSVLLIDEEHFYIHEMVASNDGSKLALTVAPSPSIEDYLDNSTLFIYDIKSSELDEIKLDNFSGNVLFSPDSTKLCYSKQVSWLYNNEIEVYDLSTKKTQKIETGIDEFVYVSQWIDQGMVLNYQDKTATKYVLLDKDSKCSVILGNDRDYYSGLKYADDGKSMAYLKRSREGFVEICVNGSKVTNRSKALRGRKYADKEMISWINGDGIEIEGVLSKPKDFDVRKRYPLLVIIHGGPIGTSLPFAVNGGLYPIEAFVERGFITLEPNYRGSAGYGEKFRSSNFKNLGVGDYEDVISGVDHLVDLGYADKDKVGVMGWSQGGYISAFCAAFSDRFKAISVGAGISDWATYYYNTDIPKFTKEYLGDVPFKNREIYDKTSPITYINKANTPTLIQHGGNDRRVPLANAYKLYRALKELNLEPKLVIYENMEHGPRTPGFERAINKQNLNWFCHHLLGDKLDEYYLNAEE